MSDNKTNTKPEFINSKLVKTLSASIFTNTVETKDGPKTFYKVNVSDSYFDKKSNSWKRSNSFDADHIGEVIELYEKAQFRIEQLRLEQQAENQTQQALEDPKQDTPKKDKFKPHDKDKTAERGLEA